MRRALVLLAPILVVAGLAAGCSSGAGSEGGTTSAPASTTTTKPTYADLDPADITFHAVLEIVSCTGGGIPGDTAPTTEATTSSTVPGADGTLCYVLGPAAGDGADLRDAKVYADGAGIEVAVREESVAALNEMFDACYEATAACPPASTEGRGYVAIVIDGRVISVPASNDPELASTPLVITGDFDSTQATAIADAINGG
ncbi:MAG: hypothetical protein JWO77_3581 [Ilumatobacteraceae bacterium]|nr:hypothetical protein [Ilumatobacteraceae bacterium]